MRRMHFFLDGVRQLRHLGFNSSRFADSSARGSQGLRAFSRGRFGGRAAAGMGALLAFGGDAIPAAPLHPMRSPALEPAHPFRLRPNPPPRHMSLSLILLSDGRARGGTFFRRA
jgi:hypothetical protein